MDINITLAKQNELDTISKIYLKAFNNAGVGEEWTSDTTLEFIEYMFNRQEDIFFVASDKNKIIGGCVGVIAPFYDGNNLVDIEIFVDPDYQNKQIGKKLLKHLISEALKKYKITVISLHAYRNVDFPYEWYKRIGIKESNLVLLEGKPQEIINNL